MTSDVLDACQWCGGERVVTKTGAIMCRHCDRGHDASECDACTKLTDARVVFDRNGGGAPGEGAAA